MQVILHDFFILIKQNRSSDIISVLDVIDIGDVIGDVVGVGYLGLAIESERTQP